jgi:hypothetical protein
MRPENTGSVSQETRKSGSVSHRNINILAQYPKKPLDYSEKILQFPWTVPAPVPVPGPVPQRTKDMHEMPGEISQIICCVQKNGLSSDRKF